MIQGFVDKLIGANAALLTEFRTDRPTGYESLLKRLIELLSEEEDWHDYGTTPDPTRITVINHGDYQGTLLFIVGAKGYQPNTYYSVFVDYGSCSGCDTFQAVSMGSWRNEVADEKEVNGYFTMMLHMVQSMKKLN